MKTFTMKAPPTEIDMMNAIDFAQIGKVAQWTQENLIYIHNMIEEIIEDAPDEIRTAELLCDIRSRVIQSLKDNGIQVIEPETETFNPPF